MAATKLEFGSSDKPVKLSVMEQGTVDNIVKDIVKENLECITDLDLKIGFPSGNFAHLLYYTGKED